VRGLHTQPLAPGSFHAGFARAVWRRAWLLCTDVGGVALSAASLL